MQQKQISKKATGADTSNFTAKSDLAGLKAETDRIDVGKLKTDAVVLNKLSNVVKNEIVKKLCMINWLQK